MGGRRQRCDLRMYYLLPPLPANNNNNDHHRHHYRRIHIITIYTFCAADIMCIYAICILHMKRQRFPFWVLKTRREQVIPTVRWTIISYNIWLLRAHTNTDTCANWLCAWFKPFQVFVRCWKKGHIRNKTEKKKQNKNNSQCVRIYYLLG